MGLEQETGFNETTARSCRSEPRYNTMATGGSGDGQKKSPPEGPKIVNHFHFGNFNGLITFGTSSGNTINVGPEVRIKLDGPPELFDRMVSMIDAKGENSSITIAELQQQCDCTPLGFRKGCVELTLRVGSQKGLEKLLALCNSGDLVRQLGREFPVTGVRVVEEDIANARRFLEEENAKMKNELKRQVEQFEEAANEYVRRRVQTVKLLCELVEYITRRQRQAQAASVAGGLGVGLAVFTLGASFLLSAAAAGTAVAIVAVIVQGVTAKISTDEAKAIMAKDKLACDRVQAILDKIDFTLSEWKGKEEGLLIDSIHDLVRVDMVNLTEGEDTIKKMEGRGRGEFVQFVVLRVELDKILVHVLDMFSGDVSKMAKKIQDIADKLACPNEESMRQLVSKIKARFQIDSY